METGRPADLHVTYSGYLEGAAGAPDRSNSRAASARENTFMGSAADVSSVEDQGESAAAVLPAMAPAGTAGEPLGDMMSGLCRGSENPSVGLAKAGTLLPDFLLCSTQRGEIDWLTGDQHHVSNTDRAAVKRCCLEAPPLSSECSHVKLATPQEKLMMRGKTRPHILRRLVRY